MRFPEILAAARALVTRCPSACETACVDCLQTFRNGFYHKHLNRGVAEECFAQWGDHLVVAHPIPAKQPTKESDAGGQPVNEVERRLLHLLRQAGFSDGLRGRQILLDRAIGSTTPDVIYRAAKHDEDEGVCIYLDGLSDHLHGNAKTMEQDRRIREWMRGHGYEVIEIPVNDLFDAGAMTRHFRRLASYLDQGELRDRLKASSDWFPDKGAAAAPAGPRRPVPVQSKPEERYVTCVPLVPLKVAAGSFGDPQNVDDEAFEWVAVDSGRRLSKGMFVAEVVGKSMEPVIPDGSFCLFSAPVSGTRQGRIVLAQLLDTADPETGQRFTVKRYESEKVATDEGWRQTRVRLLPSNPAFPPIVLDAGDEGRVSVVAEFLHVV